MHRAALFFTLILFAWVSIFASPIMVPLDAYKNAVNSGNPSSILPYLADSFEYLGTKVPLSVNILKKMIYLAPYTINSFENVKTTPEEGILRVDFDAIVSIFDLNDTIPMAFLLKECDGFWKLYAVVEPSAERSSRTRSIIGAISTPMIVDRGKIFVDVDFGDGQRRKMVIHNARPKTIISQKFADELGVENGKIEKLSLCGITKEDFPVDVGDIDVERVGRDDVVGALGGDFFGNLTILIDNTDKKISLIDRDSDGKYTVPLDRFGIGKNAKFETNFLGDNPFPMISVDLGLGFEAPMVLDASFSEIVLFSSFFKEAPGLKMDEEMRDFIAQHPGRIFTHKYIAVGKVRKDRVNSKISGTSSICGYEFPEGTAGIIGISFFDGEKIVIDNKNKKLSVY
ncbi:hypothetical protein J7M00_08680 [bacterium]|nr:hypothetical protein [bacterium]